MKQVSSMRMYHYDHRHSTQVFPHRCISLYRGVVTSNDVTYVTVPSETAPADKEVNVFYNRRLL